MATPAPDVSGTLGPTAKVRMTGLSPKAPCPSTGPLRRTPLLFAAAAALLLFEAVPLSAQRYNFHHYPNREGLPQSQVLALHQDHEGYIWFGTYGGLGRYDGAAIRSYTSADGLSSNVVVATTEDAAGRLYLGTLGGGMCVMEGGPLDAFPEARACRPMTSPT